MINILVCDDDKNYSEIIGHKVAKIFETKLKIEHRISFCDNLEALEAHISNEKFDIVFLDIMINEQNSVDWLIVNKAKSYSTQYIVMTSFPIESYRISEADSCYFLIKSKITDAQLLNSIKTAINNLSKSSVCKKIIKSGSRNYTINLPEITYIETFNNNIVIHIVTGEEYTIYSSLKAFSAMLTPNFLRCHKSFMVNMNYICGYEPHQFLLKNDLIVQISPKTYFKIVDEYRNYLLNL